MATERAGSASAPHPGGPSVDAAVFSELVADLGTEHIAEVCRLYREHADREVHAVRQAVDSGDFEAAAAAAHRLKSASGFLGAARLADLCAAVEAGAAAGDAGETLNAELRRTSDALDLLVRRFRPHESGS